MELLAGAGLTDPLPERDSTLPVDRYELARRIAHARAVVEAIRNLDFEEPLPGPDSARGATVRVVAAAFQLERAKSSDGFYAGGPGSGDTVAVDGATISSRDALILIENRFRELSADVAWLLTGQIGLDEPAARTRLGELGAAAEAIAQEAAGIADRLASRSFAVPGGPGEPQQVPHQAAQDYEGVPESTERARASLEKTLIAWLRWSSFLQGQQDPGRPDQPGDQDEYVRRANELAQNLEALESEYASELAALRPRGGYLQEVLTGSRGDARTSLSLREAAADSGSRSAVPQADGTGREEVSGVSAIVDRLTAGFVAKTGSDLTGPGTEYGWAPATGLGRMDGGDVSEFAPTVRIGAEYPASVKGIELRAGLGWEAGPFGETGGPEATLEASVPVFGGRAGIGAAFTVVDLDRLRQLAGEKPLNSAFEDAEGDGGAKLGGGDGGGPTDGGRANGGTVGSGPEDGGPGGDGPGLGGSGGRTPVGSPGPGGSGGTTPGGGSKLGSSKVAGANAGESERGGKVKSWSIGGTVPIADVASIKVGYEVRTAGSPARAQDEVLGAGVEYYLGSQGKVRAEYQWGTVDQRRGSSAGVGIGYRIGEHASLSASYSLIRFEAEDETYRDNLGAAKLELRF